MVKAQKHTKYNTSSDSKSSPQDNFILSLWFGFHCERNHVYTSLLSAMCELHFSPHHWRTVVRWVPPPWTQTNEILRGKLPIHALWLFVWSLNCSETGLALSHWKKFACLQMQPKKSWFEFRRVRVRIKIDNGGI